MRKWFRKLAAVLLAVVMAISMVSVAIVSVSAVTFNESYTLGSNPIENLIAVAEAQTGRNQSQMGYNVPWCALFVSDCAAKAGISDIIPRDAYCGTLYQNIKNAGGEPVDSPMRGDIVFYYCTASNCPGSGAPWVHVGIMTSSNSSIEGNSNGRVTAKSRISYTDMNGHTYGHSGTNSVTVMYLRPKYKDEPDNSHNPVGSLDSITTGNGVVNMGGWAFDNDDVNAQLEINVYIGGVAGDPNAEPHGNIWANGYRPDVNNVYGCGDYHGFTASISTSKTGVQDIYVYALNVGSGWHSILGCVTVDIPPVNNPVTNLDLVEGKQSAVFIQGWAFDEDDINSTIDIRVIIGDQNTEEHLITANTERKDVNKVYSCGDNHGFKSTIFTSKKGTQHIQIYAINIGSGKDVFVGEQTVNIAEDSERPTIEQYYTSHVEHNQYKVCVIPKDNIGINIVRIATWTQDDQSDLIWNDAVDNGVGTFYVDIKRSDFSQTENSLYHNHIYVYDYAGNVRFQSIDMDYKITSNTGENVPEGDYRIITAVNENKALDVFSESMDDDANIQIFSNLNNQNQIFSLSYIDNGFYKISNIKSNKPIDVYGDNYVSGTNVVLSHYHGGANQQWMLQPAGDGYYYIIARSNGLALDVYYAIDEDGTNVQVHTPNQSAAQKWKLRRVLKQDMVKVVSWKLVNGIMKPNVKVIVDGKFLVENTDYTVSSYIENNTLCAKITGIDNYCDSVSIEYQEPKYQIADTNLDGNINVRDVTAIQRHLADLETFTEEQLAVADTNGDGNVDIADATHLQMYLAEYGVVLGKQ